MINGILIIDKEKGYTSHDVVAKLRGMIGQRKIGHTGTLDPEATGVLPVCLGKATKVCGLLTDKEKVYETELLLGVSYDTQDTTGMLLKERDISALTEAQVQGVIMSYLGTYAQVPPMYSALKVNGKKLYELAREGVTVERKAREVNIYEIDILAMNLPRVSLRIRCSKGTYIRTLCHDIGEDLGVGGAMNTLRRTAVADFTLADSIRLGELARLIDEGHLEKRIIPIDRVFDRYPAGVVKREFESLAYNGNKLTFAEASIDPVQVGERVRLYNEDGEFIGLYEEDKQRLKVHKMFYDSEAKRED
ncbi:tRNA pseudouridine55 synthase [Lachnospiraceae bacterium PFB1-21]